MLAELEARDIVYIKNIDTFEDKYVSPLGHILAWRAAPEFGAAADQALAALSQQAEEHLNEMSGSRSAIIRREQCGLISR